MNIAYLMQEGAVDMDVVSGPQLHVKAVVQGLQRREHDVRVFTPRDGQPMWCDDLGSPAWQPATFGFSRRGWFRAIERPLRRAQTEFKIPYFNLFESIRFADAASRAFTGCDLVFERFGFMGYAGRLAASRLRVPSILEINGDIPKEMDVLGVSMSPAQRRLSMTIVRRTLQAADGIVCVAPALKDRLIHDLHLDARKIEAIHNGADAALFTVRHNPDEVRQRFGLAARPTVTFVGSFQPWHGVDLLLDSFAQVSAARPDAQLLLVGDGAGRLDAERRVAEAGLRDTVRFMGRLENARVAQVLAITDITVVPFPYTTCDIVGSPLKLFEYMIAGCPTVASSTPIHDVIEDQVTGLRVPPANAAALAGAVLHLLARDDLRQTMGATARQVGLKNYTWESTVERLEAFFQKVLASHGDRKARS